MKLFKLKRNDLNGKSSPQEEMKSTRNVNMWVNIKDYKYISVSLFSQLNEETNFSFKV